jgi:hypothetical protein
VNGNNYDIDDVLRIADQAVHGKQFVRAVATLMATLNTHPMPEEARQAIVEAAEIAIVEGFGLGLCSGWDVAERWAPTQQGGGQRALAGQFHAARPDRPRDAKTPDLRTLRCEVSRDDWTSGEKKALARLGANSYDGNGRVLHCDDNRFLCG